MNWLTPLLSQWARTTLQGAAALSYVRSILPFLPSSVSLAWATQGCVAKAEKLALLEEQTPVAANPTQCR